MELLDHIKHIMLQPAQPPEGEGTLTSFHRLRNAVGDGPAAVVMDYFIDVNHVLEYHKLVVEQSKALEKKLQRESQADIDLHASVVKSLLRCAASKRMYLHKDYSITRTFFHPAPYGVCQNVGQGSTSCDPVILGRFTAGGESAHMTLNLDMARRLFRSLSIAYFEAFRVGYSARRGIDLDVIFDEVAESGFHPNEEDIESVRGLGFFL